MTILVTSDLQLCDNPRDAYRHEFQKQLRAIVKKHDVKLTLILGDLTEEKDHHGAWLVNKIVDHLDRLRSLCDVVFVMGNHDYVDINAPFYQFVRHIGGINWINEPTDVNAAHLSLEFVCLGKVLLLPHTTNYKKDWAAFKLKAYDWIFTHNTFQSAHAGPGFQLRGIPTNIFAKGTRIISGDIHIPQILDTGGGAHIEYVGSPYLCDFGDCYTPRVLLIERDGRIRSVPVSGPQKRLVDVSTIAELTDLYSGKINPGDILKVRMQITGKQKTEWPELKSQIREWGEKNGYLIHVVQPVLLDGIRGHVGKQRKHKQRSDEELLRTYAKHRGIDAVTLKAGLNVMRQV